MNKEEKVLVEACLIPVDLFETCLIPIVETGHTYSKG